MAARVDDVRIEREEARGAPPVVRVTLPPALDARAAGAARDRLARMLDGLRGGPFSLLLDVRGLARADGEALAALKAAEREAVGRPGLRRVAHLVADRERAAAAQAEAGIAAGTLGIFAEDGEARAFLGMRPSGGEPT